MTPKKFTRGAFYILGIAFALTLLLLLTEFTIRNWNEMRNVILSLALGLFILGLVRLALWAFTPEPTYTYETDPHKSPYRSHPNTFPNYFDSEESGLLSDGRSAVPHHKNGKFIGRFPEYPYADEKIGDYRWGKTYEFNPKGEWLWIYEGKDK